MKNILALLAVAAIAVVFTSCGKEPEQRIPPAPVYIDFPFEHDWTIKGTPGAGSFKYFIKADGIPSDYNYSAINETGFAGVLLACDVMGVPVAYDLACPYERKSNVRVEVKDDNRAHCPKCGSVFEVFINNGRPVSGPAATKNYWLQRYNVGPTQRLFMLVSR